MYNFKSISRDFAGNGDAYTYKLKFEKIDVKSKNKI